MIAVTIVCAVITLAVMAAFSLRSIANAYRTGYDAGWVDRGLDDARRDRKRREKNGQFKPKHRNNQ